MPRCSAEVAPRRGQGRRCDGCPPRPRRVHGPRLPLAERRACRTGFENTLGYNPIRLEAYAEATGAGDLPMERKFSPLFPSYKSMLADILGLRFIAAGQPLEWIDKALKTGDLKLLAKTDDGWIYENPRALPRVIMAAQSWGADFAELMKTGRWPEGFDPARMALIEGSNTRAVHVLFGARPDLRADGAHRHLSQHRGGGGSREPARRLAGAQRPLAPLVVRRRRRPLRADPQGQRHHARGRVAARHPHRALPLPAARRRVCATSSAMGAVGAHRPPRTN